jgi:hypothetical protein
MESSHFTSPSDLLKDQIKVSRDDLLDAQAGVDWADAQIPILEARIEAWRKSPAYELIEELHPQNGEKLYKLTNIRRLPSIVNAEAGLIINSLRCSLDLLANTLAKRNGHVNPKGVQFPICRSRLGFFQGKHAGQKEIRLLSDSDRKIIEDLEPWDGGHPHLFDLHTLDITRKHRNLIRVTVLPRQYSVSIIDGERGFRFGGVWKGFENDAIVGWTKIDAPKPDFEISLEVALSEGRPLPMDTVLSVLNKLARSVAAIIKLFDP